MQATKVGLGANNRRRYRPPTVVTSLSLPYLQFSPLPLSACPSHTLSTLLSSSELQFAARPHPFFLSPFCSWVVSLQKGGGGEGGAKGEGLARLLESLAVLTKGRRCGWASESADFPLLSTRGHKGQPWRARETRSHPRLCAHTHNCTKTCTPLHTHTERHTDTFPAGSRAQPCTHSHWHALACTRSRGPAAVGSLAFTLWARTHSAAHRATHARSHPHTPRPWRRSGRCAAPATGGDPGGGGGGGDSGGGGAGSRERAGPRSSWRPGIFQPGS